MNPQFVLLENPGDEIPQLVHQFQQTLQRLQELTGGELDSVLLQEGGAYLLQEAQEKLRASETAQRDTVATQSAILDALPAHIALLDPAGVILSVNAGWRIFADENNFGDAAHGLGQNYLEICDRAQGRFGEEAGAAAAGIRAVLSGTRSQFSLEYPCHSAKRSRWFRLVVNPVRHHGPSGVVIMHVDISEGINAVEKLQQKQSELQILFDLMPAMVWFKDTQNGILRVNQRAAEATGKTVAEIEGKSMVEIFPHHAAKYFADDLEVIRTGAPKFEIIEHLRDRHDRELLVQTDKVPVRDHTGKVTGIVVMAQDVTARKRTEARFRRLVESNAQGVFFWNTRGEVSDGNEAFLNLVGYTREDLTAGRLHWAAMTPPEYAALDQRALREATTNGACAPYEKEFIRKDGNRTPVLIGAAVFEDNPDEGVAFVLDLTEHVKTEAALRQSEKRFKTLFEQAAVGVAQVSIRTGKHVQVNQRFCEIVGRRADELLQLDPAHISHPQDDVRCQQLLGQVIFGAIREYTVEKRYLRPDGSEVWAGVTVSSMWVPGEAPDCVMVVVQDITARRQLEDAFRQAQKMEAMGTLAGGIAHDFNNILASINGYTQLAQMVLVGNPQVREFLAAVLQAGDRAVALVRQILAFSRQERLVRAPVQLGPILKETLKLLRATIPVTTEFVISLAPDAPPVLADANQIHQIMMNLGTNAWHALPQGTGRIEFRLERCWVDAVHAARQPRLRPGLYARISVSDTGCGMDPATLRRIFEPFFTTKPPGEGTGLGLSVVHGIMETHDGIVAVESQPGVGTIFHLYFPALNREAAATAIELGPVPVGSGQRILLVDDEDLLARLGLNTLSQLGYEVVITTQPLAALEMVRTDPSRFDLVITDQTMPGMTGLALASHLLKIRPGLPILLMTGYSLIVTPENVRAAGIRQLLLKPASLHSLGSAIHAALASPAPSPT